MTQKHLVVSPAHHETLRIYAEGRGMSMRKAAENAIDGFMACSCSDDSRRTLNEWLDGVFEGTMELTRDEFAGFSTAAKNWGISKKDSLLVLDKQKKLIDRDKVNDEIVGAIHEIHTAFTDSFLDVAKTYDLNDEADVFIGRMNEVLGRYEVEE